MTRDLPPVPPTAGLLSALLFCALALFVGLGFSSGTSLWDTLTQMFEDPWGRATLVDLLVGFLLFGMWLWSREASKPRALLWITATFLLGNLVPCVYVILAALRGKRRAAGEGDPITT